MRSLRDWTYYPITTRSLRVLRSVEVTPGMRRVTLGGENLAAHTAPSGFPVHKFRSDGFDDEFKLFLKHPEAERALVPTQLEGVLDWPRHPHLVARTYTVRRWDAKAGEVDVDLVLHGDGPAARWAEQVRPGEFVDVAGPKMSGGHPVGADWCLIAGDETALPSIARWLEEWPSGARAQVFVEVEQHDHVQDLPEPEGVAITWIIRDGARHCDRLVAAVMDAEWWPGQVFAWAAGEALGLVPLRRWLRRVRGLPKEHVDVTGYWRRPVTEPDRAATAPKESTAETVGEAVAAAPAEGTDVDVDHAGEFVEPLAVRVAMTIGLSSALGAAPASVSELAAATGCPPTGLAKLLRYLAAAGIVERSGAPGERRYTWAPGYRELDDDWYADHLSLDSPKGRTAMGALSLLGAVRTGRARNPLPGLIALGLASDDDGVTARQLRGRMVAEDDDAQFLAGPLAGSGVLDGVGDLRISGPGAPAIARAVLAAHPSLRVRVRPADPQLVPALTADAGRYEVEDGGLFEAGAEQVDLHLLVDTLGVYPDDAAIAVLRTARRGAARVATAGECLDDDNLDDHECEDDLIAFCTTGGGLRTRTEHDDLVTRSGLELVSTTTVGWGFDVRVHR